MMEIDMRFAHSGGLLACAMLVGASAALAQNAPDAPRPANAKAICKDGTYTTSTVRQSACAQHGGIKQWLRRRGSRDTTGYAPSATDTSRMGRRHPMNCDTTMASPDSSKNRYHCPGDDTSGMMRDKGRDRRGHDSTGYNGANRWLDSTRQHGGNDTTRFRGDDTTSTPAPGLPSDSMNSMQRDVTDSTAQGATAKCRDGSYSHKSLIQRTGVCVGHRGVDQWLSQ